MPLNELLTTSKISALFAEEIAAAGGTVSDTFDDESRLFTRSILSGAREVQLGDVLRAGVALRATDQGVWVYPYVSRQVCRNGSIITHAAQMRHLEPNDFATPDAAVVAVREAIRACCDEEAFTNACADIQSSREKIADVGFNLFPVLSRLPPEIGTQVFRLVIETFFDGEDVTRYGLMNAVTSVARDTSDPETRWQLEVLGGSIPIAEPPAPEADGLTAETAMAGGLE